jgi:hypothetical protein
MTMVATMAQSRGRGRPSNFDVAQREDQARQIMVAQLTQAVRHLNQPSRLSDSPICDLESVRQQATILRGYRYPRAQVVIRTVRQAYETAWAELGGTEDAAYLQALADALAGVPRRESARRASVSQREITTAAVRYPEPRVYRMARLLVAPLGSTILPSAVGADGWRSRSSSTSASRSCADLDADHASDRNRPARAVVCHPGGPRRLRRPGTAERLLAREFGPKFARKSWTRSIGTLLPRAVRAISGWR